jgi:hypothetical protein
MRDALTKPEPLREWLEAAQARCQRRMHSTDTASLQAEVEQLRLYVTVLFRLLVARGVFTVEEAQQLVVELEAASAEPTGAAGRDMVSGDALPPKENPFRKLTEARGPRSEHCKGTRRVRSVRWLRAVGLAIVAVSALAAAVIAVLVRF